MKKAVILLALIACQRVSEPIIPEHIVHEVYHELSDWEVLQMAIIMTESKGNPDAAGKTSDLGILQITPVYVKEVNRLGGDYSHEDAFSIEKSLEMFEIVQSRHNPERDIDKAIRLHNKAPWYKDRVKKNMTIIRRMEAARKAIYEENL